MLSRYFGKKQSTLLTATIFYKNEEGKLMKYNMDFVLPLITIIILWNLSNTISWISSNKIPNAFV